jgi:hypothetical protein
MDDAAMRKSISTVRVATLNDWKRFQNAGRNLLHVRPLTPQPTDFNPDWVISGNQWQEFVNHLGRA